MIQTETLVIGASIAGLAVAACLQEKGLPYTIIEKEEQIAAPWRNHYDRLHLHTNKRISSLPYKKFDDHIPMYASRAQVISYLEDYQKHFNIQPLFNTRAITIKRTGQYWITGTNNETFRSNYLVMATGAYENPKPVLFPGIESFPGKVLHSCAYKSGKEFAGKNVLVAGFGNSACEIAIDLYEHGAFPTLSVRSPVNIIPRDIAGIPILELSILMSRLPPRLADAINAPLLRLLIGDIRKLGLQKKLYGPFEQIQKEKSIPVLDIGTVKLIRQRHIHVQTGIDNISGNTVHFVDGKKKDFDAIVACIGYKRGSTTLIDLNDSRWQDLNVCTKKQQFFGTDGLYFCGFWISPSGQIREIASEARKIAKDIVKKNLTPAAG